MSKRKLQEFDEFQYGVRGVLKRGDKFRVSGGPYYVNDDGSKSLMAERGMFVFKRYCTMGSQKWIEAKHQDCGDVVLWVGKAVKNPLLPSFCRRPYTVRKITDRNRKPKKVKSTKASSADSAPVASKKPRSKSKSAAVSAESPRA